MHFSSHHVVIGACEQYCFCSLLESLSSCPGGILFKRVLVAKLTSHKSHAENCADNVSSLAIEHRLHY